MKGKQTKSAKPTKTVETKAAKPKSQSAMIVDMLKRKVGEDKILDAVKKACGGSPTKGYIRWIAKHNNLKAVAA